MVDDELAATGREESDPGYLRNGELRKIFGKSEPTLERAQALWDRAYEQAARNAENGQKNTAREGGEKTRYNTKNEVLDRCDRHRKTDQRIKGGLFRPFRLRVHAQPVPHAKAPRR